MHALCSRRRFLSPRPTSTRLPASSCRVFRRRHVLGLVAAAAFLSRWTHPKSFAVASGGNGGGACGVWWCGGGGVVGATVGGVIVVLPFQPCLIVVSLPVQTPAGVFLHLLIRVSQDTSMSTSI